MMGCCVPLGGNAFIYGWQYRITVANNVWPPSAAEIAEIQSRIDVNAEWIFDSLSLDPYSNLVGRGADGPIPAAQGGGVHESTAVITGTFGLTFNAGTREIGFQAEPHLSPYSESVWSVYRPSTGGNAVLSMHKLVGVAIRPETEAGEEDPEDFCIVTKGGSYRHSFQLSSAIKESYTTETDSLGGFTGDAPAAFRAVPVPDWPAFDLPAYADIPQGRLPDAIGEGVINRIYWRDQPSGTPTAPPVCTARWNLAP